MRRWLAIGGALILAAAGAFLLISYVRGAENRALEGHTLVGVLVVRQPIEQGSTIDEVRDKVELKEIEANSLAAGAVADLDDLAGRVTSTELVPGEQLLASRFVTPERAATEDRVEVPPDLLQATVALSPERAVGGRLVAGDRVAVVASFMPFDLNVAEPGDPGSLDEFLDSIIVIPGGSVDPGAQTSRALPTPVSTHIIIHKVLITGVQVQEAPRESEDGTAIEFAPTGSLLITLAATAEDLERILFSMEHGSVWLALEDPEAPEPVTEIRTRRNIY